MFFALVDPGLLFFDTFSSSSLGRHTSLTYTIITVIIICIIIIVLLQPEAHAFCSLFFSFFYTLIHFVSRNIPFLLPSLVYAYILQHKCLQEYQAENTSGIKEKMNLMYTFFSLEYFFLVKKLKSGTHLKHYFFLFFTDSICFLSVFPFLFYFQQLSSREKVEEVRKVNQ